MLLSQAVALPVMAVAAALLSEPEPLGALQPINVPISPPNAPTITMDAELVFVILDSLGVQLATLVFAFLLAAKLRITVEGV